ncbi:MAG: hypothetical protein AUF79_02180 [Crenarchaeota archaeon 13_1_20CM_2_51_8]|nr:MAG: hypothetical protein AUF79_02180 [Crenarchaeota archaeon 13_1_20CM_2_51_8]
MIFRRIKREPQTRFSRNQPILRPRTRPENLKTEHLNAELDEPNTRPGGESSICDTCAAHNPTKKKKK